MTRKVCESISSSTWFINLELLTKSGLRVLNKIPAAEKLNLEKIEKCYLILTQCKTKVDQMKPDQTKLSVTNKLGNKFESKIYV